MGEKQQGSRQIDRYTYIEIRRQLEREKQRDGEREIEMKREQGEGDIQMDRQIQKGIYADGQID